MFKMILRLTLDIITFDVKLTIRDKINTLKLLIYRPIEFFALLVRLINLSYSSLLKVLSAIFDSSSLSFLIIFTIIQYL